MALFFSPSTRGFYSADNHDTMPDDVVTITPARHRALMEGQAEGATIATGPDGHPRLQRPSAPNAAEKRSRLIRATKREAERRILAVSPLWRQLNDLRLSTQDGAARFALIDAIRAASAKIEAAIAATGAADLARFDVAAHAAWEALS